MKPLKVIETFAGIGAQKEALNRANIEHEIVHTVEWDIHAIMGYAVMHHHSLKPSRLSKEKIIEKLSQVTLSSDGKTPLSTTGLKSISEEKLQLLYASIQKNKNLCDITKIRGDQIPNDTDLLTYSFPCQDLSNARAFHYQDNEGISKGANTRSGLLWEIERILREKFSIGADLPTFLLMENVNAINSPKHNANFLQWQKELEEMGYVNKVYRGLVATDFGVPQQRSRTFMLSVRTDSINEIEMSSLVFHKPYDLSKYLRLEKYPDEEIAVTPNMTPSRKKILENNKHLAENGKVIAEFANTISTKQDRNPNAGVILQKNGDMRYLTNREAFLLMGFPEKKFNKLKRLNHKHIYFSESALIKMAGNSIVVDVLVEIFKEIERIKLVLLEKTHTSEEVELLQRLRGMKE